MNNIKRAIFLDRDGVLNRKANEGDYIKTWKEFVFLPLTKKAIKLLAQTDFMLIVITNQRGVAKGVMSESALNLIHYNMCNELRKTGGRIDHIFYCTHDIENNCNCRKPRIGMFLQAQSKLGVYLQESYLIGDSMSDIEAGIKAGCKETILIDADGDFCHTSYPIKPDMIVKNIYESASYILKKS